MGLFSKNPLGGRFMRRLYRKSGMLYLPCDGFKNMVVESPVLLLVDTGTTHSILLKEFVDNASDGDPGYIGDGKVLSAQGEISAKLLNTSFQDSMGRVYDDDFLVIDDSASLSVLTREVGLKVVGIVGTNFMDRYGVIINFKTKEIDL